MEYTVQIYAKDFYGTVDQLYRNYLRNPVGPVTPEKDLLRLVPLIEIYNEETAQWENAPSSFMLGGGGGLDILGNVTADTSWLYNLQYDNKTSLPEEYWDKTFRITIEFGEVPFIPGALQIRKTDRIFDQDGMKNGWDYDPAYSFLKLYSKPSYYYSELYIYMMFSI